MRKVGEKNTSPATLAGLGLATLIASAFCLAPLALT